MKKKELLKTSAMALCMVMVMTAGCAGKEKIPEIKMPQITDGESVIADEDEIDHKLDGDGESKPKPDAGDEDENEASKKSTGHIIIPQISHNYIDRADGRSVLYYSRYDLITLGEAAEDYPELEKMLDARNDQVSGDLDEQADSMAEEAKQFREDMDYEQPFYDNSKIYMRRSDEEVFSYVVEAEMFAGGAHGMYGLGGYNYYTQTGDEIYFEDVVADEDLLKETLVYKLEKEYPDVEFFESGSDMFEPYDGSDEGYIFNFVLEPEGVTFIFNPYELAPYAYGKQTVTIGYDEEPGLFTDKFSAPSGAYVLPFGYYDQVKVYDKRGRERILQVVSNYDYDSEGLPGEYTLLSVEINYGKNKITEADMPIAYSYGQDLYLVHTDDDRNLLYIESVGDSDWREISCYELMDDGEIEVLGSVQGRLWLEEDWRKEGGWQPAIFDPNGFDILTTLNVMSTASGIRHYHIGEDGMPEAETEYFTLLSEIELKSVKDLEVRFLGETKDIGPDAEEIDDGNAKRKTLPAGTQYMLWRTDSLSYMDTLVKEGSKYKVYRFDLEFDDNGYMPEINGYDINDCFEELFWAG